MTNALTGGFDVCVELDRTLITSLAAPILLDDPSISRPVLPVAIGSTRGQLTVFLTGAPVEVAPGGEPALRLTLPFTEGGLRIDAPRPDSAGDLEGNVKLTVPISLGPVETAADGGRVRRFVLDLARVRDVAVTFRESSTSALRDLARRLGVDDGALVDGIENAVQALAPLVAGLGLRPVDAGINLARPGEDGGLAPLTFVDVTLATARSTGAFANRVLVLLGTLLRSHAGRGIVAEKQEVALASGDHAVVVLAPEAFRDAVLAPQLLRALLPIHLDRHLPDDFLARLPAGTLDRFLADITDPTARTERRRRLARQRAERDNQGFFDDILPRPLPRDATAAVGPEITSALPAELLALLRDTRAAVRTLLPAQCGDADFFYVDYAKIASIGVHFLDGRIRIDGHVLPDVTGLEGFVDFWTDLTLSVVGDEVVPTATEPQLRSSIDFAWWAYALLPVLAGFVYVAEEAIHALARGELRRTLDRAIGELQSVVLDLPLGVTIRSLDVEPNGMIVRATAPVVRIPVDLPSASVSVTAGVPMFRDLPAERRQVSNDCVNGVFEVRRRQVQRQYAFVASTEVIPSPRFEWFVDDGRVDGRGSLRDRDGRPVLHFNVQGNTLRLTNEWGSPSLVAAVRCRAIGADGTTAEAEAGAYFEPTREIWPADYTEAVSGCIRDRVRDLEGLLAVGPNRIFGGRYAALVDRLRTIGAGDRDPVANQLGLSALRQVSELSGRAVPRWLQAVAVPRRLNRRLVVRTPLR